MTSLVNLFMGVFYLIAISSMISCDSTPSIPSVPSSNGQVQEIEKEKTFPCTLCDGSGIYAGYSCNRCGGTGIIVANYTEQTSTSEISFKGKGFYYGPCNNGCGCNIYEHAPGKTQCVNCTANNCTTNKFGHKKIYPTE